MGSTKCLSEYHGQTPPKAAILLLSQKLELLGYRVRAVLTVGEKSKLAVLQPLFPRYTHRSILSSSNLLRKSVRNA